MRTYLIEVSAVYEVSAVGLYEVVYQLPPVDADTQRTYPHDAKR